MPFLRNFDDDVFISYATIDDEPLTEGQKGWVTHFHRDLEKRVAQLLGAEAKIWRDDRELRGNERFADKIHEQLPKSGVLVSVLSPRYFRSDWCMTEFREFCMVAQQTGGLHTQDHKSRLFKVVKTPVEASLLPAEMQQILSYEFFELDENGRPLEYNREFGDEAKFKYARKLNDLAYDIANFLRLLSGQLKTFAPRATVYLADTTADLKEMREEVWRDLLQRGFAVLPDRDLSADAADFKDQVRGFLQRCDMSVHLIGERYGAIPDGETQSHVVLQSALAAERCHDDGFLRVIWMPPGIQAKDTRQQAFIDSLRNDSDAQKRTEILQTKLEDLKSFIEDTQAAAQPKTPKTECGGPSRIYVVADQRDIESGAVQPLESYLFDHGYEVILSLSASDEAQTRKDHVENLQLCDVAIIYYGQAGELWLRSKLNDFRKVLDARTEPVRARAIYIAPPETEHKRHFQTREALIIRSVEGFAPGALAPLVQAAGAERK
jgi:TIR domain-containing protein/uncharacterized protein DUF4062